MWGKNGCKADCACSAAMPCFQEGGAAGACCAKALETRQVMTLALSNSLFNICCLFHGYFFPQAWICLEQMKSFYFLFLNVLFGFVLIFRVKSTMHNEHQ
jgi:hypothetical protein